MTVNDTHSNFDIISRKIQKEDYEGLFELMDYEECVNSLAQKANLDFKVVDGVVYHGDTKLDTALGNRLLQELQNGHPLQAWFEFAKKVLANPSKCAREELCLFIEAGNIALCDDGDFLAYKMVRSNFKDGHTGTMDNSPGQTVKMPRDRVDANRQNECSRGLHFCSYNYLRTIRGHGGADTVVLLKINPFNVISIPRDYNNTKGRACEYYVVCSLKGWEDKDVLENMHGSVWVKGHNGKAKAKHC